MNYSPLLTLALSKTETAQHNNKKERIAKQNNLQVLRRNL
jgi:hypothetical protein